MNRTALFATGLAALGLAQFPLTQPGLSGVPTQPSPPAAPVASRAQPTEPADQRPTTKVLNCTTGGCHATEMDHPFQHGPVAVGACDACHVTADAAAHTFALRRQGRELCIFCHIDKSGTEASVVHEPFAKGECSKCHDPHGSSTRSLIGRSSVTEMCTSCHQETMRGSHSHKPAAEGCTACHLSHSSSHAKLLTKEPMALCQECHEPVTKSIQALAHPHKPAQGDCLKCHSPHASDQARILKQSPKKLCLSCHQEFGKKLESVAHPHSAVDDERSCLNCHAAHASDHAKQLAKDTIGSCMACHSKAITVSETRVVAAANELVVDEFHKHGPILKGECAGCHDVHGGAHERLLVAPYEPGFYQRYSADSYKLCFKCHDRALVSTTGGEVSTKFRQGERNLHAVHVNSSDRGRSCRSCHTVHASRQEGMVADSVKFGEWQLPLNYAKTPTGGSCAPGCHKPESYDRGLK